jgi:hypothetical protein
MRIARDGDEGPVCRRARDQGQSFLGICRKVGGDRVTDPEAAVPQDHEDLVADLPQRQPVLVGRHESPGENLRGFHDFSVLSRVRMAVAADLPGHGR